MGITISKSFLELRLSLRILNDLLDRSLSLNGRSKFVNVV